MTCKEFCQLYTKDIEFKIIFPRCVKSTTYAVFKLKTLHLKPKLCVCVRGVFVGRFARCLAVHSFSRWCRLASLNFNIFFNCFLLVFGTVQIELLYTGVYHCECHHPLVHWMNISNMLIVLFCFFLLKLICKLAMWCLLAACQKALLCATLRKRQVIVVD